MAMAAWVALLGGVGILVVVVLFALDFLTGRRPISFKGKHVMLVGGSTGIGLAMAKQAVEEGASVSVFARSANKLLEAQQLLQGVAQEVSKKSGGKQHPVVFTAAADASKYQDMERVVQEAIAACGPVHALVCCQGICRPFIFDDWAVEGMREHMEANYWGTVNTLKAGALESVKTAGPRGTGRILIVSSQAGQCGLYGYTAYAASKFALRGLAECLQQELLPYGVRVGMLFPPDTDTPQLQEESKTKTAITKKLTAQGGAPMKASEVAAAGLAGLKRGDFLISANFSGFMLNVATAGMAPTSSVSGFVLEVLLAGLMRVVAILTLRDFHAVILDSFKGSKAKTS